MKESVDNLKIQHMCDWFQFLKIVLQIFKFLCSIHTSYSWNMIWNVCACFSVEKKENTYSPVNLHPLFLKIGHPAFLKSGAFWKKQSAINQGHCNLKREEAAWSLLFLNKEWPFCKKEGAQFLRIVGADWLGNYVSVHKEFCKTGRGLSATI